MGIAIKTTLLGSQSDEKLLELARARSEIAFEALARRSRRALLRRCRQLCLSEEMAQEVVRRALSEAQSGIAAGADPPQLHSWLHGIAQRIAVEELRRAGAPPPHDAGRVSLAAAAGGAEERAAGSPTPNEVLALRGALAAMSAEGSREAIVVHRGDGNKAKAVAEDAFELADDAVRGLLGRARRGISALTPPPLLAWAMGRAAQGGASGERMAELGASGGAAGMAGLAVKGGIVAITAGVAITGAVIAQSKSPRSPGVHHRGAPAVRAAAAAGATAGPVDARASGAAGEGAHGSARAAAGSARTSTTPRSSVTPVSAQTPSSASGQRVASTTPASQSSGAAGASESGAANGSGSGAAASGSASEQSQPAGSSGESAGHGAGVGVQVSVGGGSGQQTSGGSGAAGSAGSSSTGEASKGVGVGISVSLEPLGSVGVHVSLP